MIRRVGFTAVFMIVLLMLLAANTGAAPRAASGVLELSGSDFHSGKPIKLAGEWEFYWEELLDPADFHGPDRPRPAALLSVPGGWNAFVTEAGRIGAVGYATYRLQIHLPDDIPDDGFSHPQLALHIPWTFTAYRLWINGNPVASNGAVGRSRDEMVPEFLPVTVPFEADMDTIELIVHVSNFVHRTGGLWNAPLLGTYAQVSRYQFVRRLIDTVIIGAVLFMAMYHLVLCALLKARSPSFYLGLTALFIALRTLVTSEHTLGLLVGGLPWGMEIRIEYITGYAFLITFLGFLQSTFPEDTSKSMATAGGAVGAAGIAITVFSPVRISSQFIPVYEVIFAVFVLYSAVVFIVASMRNRDGARVILVGGLALTFSLIHDLLHYNLVGFDIDLLPLGLLALLFFQSLTVAQRFSATFRREMALASQNRELLKTVSAQLEQVKESRRVIARLDEDLRRKIAERLHGSTQNRLFRAWRQLAVAKETFDVDPQAVAMIEEAQADIEHVREVDIRQMSHQLHPSIVRVGVIPAVESLLNEYAADLTVTVDVDDDVRTRDNAADNLIPEPVRLVAYRVLEEALGNIVAHAAATSITITLRAEGDDTLAIHIQDDGIGFDPRTTTRHLGLHTIAASVDTVNGDWEIISYPGRGTTVSCRLPIR